MFDRVSFVVGKWNTKSRFAPGANTAFACLTDFDIQLFFAFWTEKKPGEAPLTNYAENMQVVLRKRGARNRVFAYQVDNLEMVVWAKFAAFLKTW